MREILFRGKTEQGKWLYGYLVKGNYNTGFGIIEDHIDTGMQYVKEETVGQFTGLMDKNGKKIFEGDILEDILCGDKERYAVIFDDYCRYVLTNNGTKNYLLARNNKDIEVIGNIFDNAELLGE